MLTSLFLCRFCTHWPFKHQLFRYFTVGSFRIVVAVLLYVAVPSNLVYLCLLLEGQYEPRMSEYAAFAMTPDSILLTSATSSKRRLILRIMQVYELTLMDIFLTSLQLSIIYRLYPSGS